MKKTYIWETQDIYEGVYAFHVGCVVGVARTPGDLYSLILFGAHAGGKGLSLVTDFVAVSKEKIAEQLTKWNATPLPNAHMEME